MKVLQEVKEVQNEGLLALIGEHVVLFCGVYIYAGRLVGVNDTCVKLEKACIVYETGGLTDKSFKDAQPLPSDLYVTTQSIESFGLSKKE